MLERADNIIPFSFPKDHGRHSKFGMEWWYLSGRLGSETKEDWAYHFTIFRRVFKRWVDLFLVGLAIGFKPIRNVYFFKRLFAKMLENREGGAIGVEGYVGHLSITNIKERQFVFFERGGISLLDMAGASQDSLRVWVKDWKLEASEGKIHLVAQKNDFGVDVNLTPIKPPILNGARGLSMKGLELGEASYHYSISLLTTSGRLKWRGNTYDVSGTSFMDREFGTSMLPKSIRGWDWFGLILDNNHEIMISLIRNTDGSMANTSSGTLVFPDGACRCFVATELLVEVVDKWTSPSTGAHYPTHWIVSVEPLDLELEILALVKEHELVSATSTTINYWEGPVGVSGKMNDRAIAGHGHVELVGYAESAGGKF
ncbi:MAG: lipocalin-like domain-containing protein [Desulfomonilaceae bacterium]|jgi:predicted secreted hydrolase